MNLTCALVRAKVHCSQSNRKTIDALLRLACSSPLPLRANVHSDETVIEDIKYRLLNGHNGNENIIKTLNKIRERLQKSTI